MKVLKFESTLRYKLEQFEPYWKKVSDNEKYKKIEFDKNLPSVNIDSLRVSGSIKKLIKQGDANNKYKTRSERDQAIITALVNANYDENTIKTIFSNTSLPISDKYSEKGDNYLSYSIHNAKKYLKNQNYKNSNILLPLDAIPQRGFFSSYMECFQEITDAPDEFLFVDILSALAGVLGDKVYIEFGAQKLKPNIWTLTIGKSSIMRKSTCIGFARDLIRQIESEDNLIILPDESSPESFLEGLEQTPSGILMLYEMGGFLVNMERAYMKGFKELLTQLYDNPPVYTKRIKNGNREHKTFTIKEPCITIVSASTFDWFTKSINNTDAPGGFLTRFFYSYIEDMTKEKIIFPRRVDHTKIATLIQELMRIQQISGKYELDEEAREIYEKWCISNEVEIKNSFQETEISPFYDRIEKGALKISMIIQASFGNSLVITEESMNYAVKICDYFKANIKYLLSYGLHSSPFEINKRKIVEILKRNNGRCDHSKLLRYSHLDAKYFKKIIETLIESEQTKIDTIKEGKKSKRLYILINSQ